MISRLVQIRGRVSFLYDMSGSRMFHWSSVRSSVRSLLWVVQV